VPIGVSPHFAEKLAEKMKKFQDHNVKNTVRRPSVASLIAAEQTDLTY